MGKYVAKRIGYMALVFLIVSFLMYSLYNLIPTDPARAELEAQKQSLKPAEYEQLYQELRAKMGLDDPLVIRYMRWMGLWPDVGDNNGFNGLLQGNFGYSQFYKKDVTEVIVDPMKNTIFINIFSTILALAITIPLGIFCAVHKGKKVDNTVQVVTMLGYSLPIYIIALIFMFFFCVLWRIFPISGTKTAGAIYATKWDEFIDMLYHITLLPIITSIIGWFISIFSGSVIIENTFSLNGMGKLYWAGLSNLDFELVLAIQMFYTIVALIGSLLMDISYGLVDPRVRVDK